MHTIQLSSNFRLFLVSLVMSTRKDVLQCVYQDRMKTEKSNRKAKMKNEITKGNTA